MLVRGTLFVGTLLVHVNVAFFFFSDIHFYSSLNLEFENLRINSIRLFEARMKNVDKQKTCYVFSE